MSILDHTVPVVAIDEPNKSYETDEFVVRRDPATDTWYAGSDSGCSCYEEFDPDNFVEYHELREVRAAFSRWIGTWHDGVGLEAAAWDAFNEAVRAVQS